MPASQTNHTSKTSADATLAVQRKS